MVDSLLSTLLYTFPCVRQGLTLLNSHGHAPTPPHLSTQGYIQESTLAQAPALAPTVPFSVEQMVALPSFLPVLPPCPLLSFHFPIGDFSIAKQASLYTGFSPLPEWLRLYLG